MVNLENIYNSPIIQEPWEHKVIDDVLSENCYQDILDASKMLTKCAKNGKTTAVWLNEISDLGVPQKTIDKIITASDEILKNLDKII
jgi:hypothetical protein